MEDAEPFTSQVCAIKSSEKAVSDESLQPLMKKQRVKRRFISPSSLINRNGRKSTNGSSAQISKKEGIYIMLSVDTVLHYE